MNKEKAPDYSQKVRVVERVDFTDAPEDVSVATVLLSAAGAALITALTPDDPTIICPITFKSGAVASLRARSVKDLYIVFFDKNGHCRKSVRRDADGAFRTEFDGMKFEVVVKTTKAKKAPVA